MVQNTTSNESFFVSDFLVDVRQVEVCEFDFRMSFLGGSVLTFLDLR